MSGQGFVVFDCDGTLIDTQAAIVSAIRAAFKDQGIQIPAGINLQRLIGLRLEEVIVRLAPRLRAAEVIRMAERYRDHYAVISQDIAYESRLFEGIEEAVMALRRAGNLIGIVTGKSRSGLYRVLDAHGIFDLFDILKTAEDGPGKPNPSLLNDAMREVKATAERTLMIGDTCFDMETAVRAGATPVGVTWGYHDVQELKEAGAVHIVDRAEDIPDFAARRLGTNDD